jgi:hypothetical protein
MERSELEKSAIKAATDCVAAAALNNPNIVKLYQQNRLKKITDWIVLESDACDNSLRAMRLLHDKIFGDGTGRKFLLGAYLADLPRAVNERIKNVVEESNTTRALPSSTKNIGAHKYFLIHNDSVMLMEIGNTSEDRTALRIYYYSPSEKMDQLVKRGDLFFDGSIQWKSRDVVGYARIYKWGCEPLRYQVKGTLDGQPNGISTLELQGWLPHLVMIVLLQSSCGTTILGSHSSRVFPMSRSHLQIHPPVRRRKHVENSPNFALDAYDHSTVSAYRGSIIHCPHPRMQPL